MTTGRTAGSVSDPLRDAFVVGQRSFYVRMGRNLAWFVRRKKLATIGAVFALAVTLVGVFGPHLAPYGKDDVFSEQNPNYDPDNSDPANLQASNPSRLALLADPSWDHPLGTDAFGRDLLTRMVHGARLSVTVGIGAAAVAAVVGGIIGIVSGYLGGRVDLAIQRVVDALLAIPALVLLLLLVQTGEPSTRLTITALAVLGVGPVTRIVRSATLVLRSEMFVEAARSLGAGERRIMIRHIAPNVVGPMIVIFSASIGTNILAEAGLSFLNLSVPGPSWGRMVADGRAFLDSKPLMSFAGGGAITIAVLGFNLLGDGLRDVLDPRQRGAGMGPGS